MNLTALILFAVIFFILGLAAALAATHLRGESKTQLPGNLPSGEEAVPPADGDWANPPVNVETSRIWRNRQTGQIIIELGGKTWQHVEELDPSQCQEVIRLSLGLQEWIKPAHLRGKLTSPGQEIVDHEIQPDLSPQKPSVRTPETTYPENLVEAPSPSQEEQHDRDPGRILSKMISARYGPKQASSQSVAAQVDNILQELLAISPLAGRRVRLEEASDQSLMVLVDHDQYDGIQAVTDEEVRAILQAAVAEWQRRMTQSN